MDNKQVEYIGRHLGNITNYLGWIVVILVLMLLFKDMSSNCNYEKHNKVMFEQNATDKKISITPIK